MRVSTLEAVPAVSPATDFSRPVLEVCDLEVRAENGGRALEKISFQLSPGERVAVVGPSGSGKTTLLRFIAGMAAPGLRKVAGTITWRGERRPGGGPALALISQEPTAALTPYLKIGHQIAEALPAGGVRARRREQAADLLRRVRLPAWAVQAYPWQLSVGMCQRVGLAIAMAGEAQLWLADEPFASLDLRLREGLVAALLERMQEAHQGRLPAMLLATHDEWLVRRLGCREVPLRNGYALCSSLPREFVPAPEGGESAPSRLTLKGVCVAWRGRSEIEQPCLSDINLMVSSMRDLAIIGESGSGKTTLARVLVGALPLSRGRLTLADAQGEEIDLVSAARRHRRWLSRAIQLVYQEPDQALDPGQRLADGFVQAVRDGLSRGLGTLAPKITSKVILHLATELFSGLGLQADHLWHYPGELSGGQRKRAALALALAGLGWGIPMRQPWPERILILDEPTVGLDRQGDYAAMKHVLLQSRRELRLTYVLLGHDLELAAQICQEGVVLFGGRMVEQGPTHRLLDPGRAHHPYTRGLLQAASLHAAEGACEPIVSAASPSPNGCVFAMECPNYARGSGCDEPQVCSSAAAEGTRGHLIACWRSPTQGGRITQP